MRTVDSALALLAIEVVDPATDERWGTGISPAERRRSPRIWQLASTAARKTCAAAGYDRPASVVVSTALGALDETRAFLEKVFVENAASPRNFIASVHNSMGGKIAMDLGVTGPNLTVCDGHNSLASGLQTVCLLPDRHLPALLMVVDEDIELLRTLAPHLTPICRDWLGGGGLGDGAAGLLLTRGDAAGPRLRICGPTPSNSAPGQESLALLARNAFGHDSGIQPLSETNTGLLAPVATLARLRAAGSPTPCIIPSYSPTANMTALVELCC
jgi:hypothetical protein